MNEGKTDVALDYEAENYPWTSGLANCIDDVSGGSGVTVSWNVPSRVHSSLTLNPIHTTLKDCIRRSE